MILELGKKIEKERMILNCLIILGINELLSHQQRESPIWNAMLNVDNIPLQ